MWAEGGRRAALLVLALALSACAPRLYERQTVALDHHELDQFEIRYAEFDGCLLRRAVPVSWRLRRPAYVLDVSVLFGSGPEAPARLALALSGGEDLSARFGALQPAPVATPTEQGPSYRIPLDADAPSTLSLEILGAGRTLGREVLRLQPQSCRALSLGEG